MEAAITDAEWTEFSDLLLTARESLQEAFDLMDGIEGFTPIGALGMDAAFVALDSVEEAEANYRRMEVVIQ